MSDANRCVVTFLDFKNFIFRLFVCGAPDLLFFFQIFFSIFNNLISLLILNSFRCGYFEICEIDLCVLFRKKSIYKRVMRFTRQWDLIFKIYFLNSHYHGKVVFLVSQIPLYKDNETESVGKFRAQRLNDSKWIPDR